MEHNEDSNKVQKLLIEIQNLKTELDQANSAKAQSIECGFVLLKENTDLNKKLAELNILYENTSHELKITQDALTKMETSHKIVSEEGIRLEESLLTESNALEISFNLQILEIEGELKQLRRELKCISNERNELIQKGSDNNKKIAESEMEKLKLKSQLKESKESEENLTKRYSELEKDYELLQKQISYLKSCESELTTCRVEIAKLLEQTENLQSQVDELKYMKKLCDRQIEELEQMLQYEKDDKIILKKEIEMLRNPDTLSTITTNLAESIKTIEERDGSTSTGDAISLEITDSEEEAENPKIDILSKVLKELKSIGTHIALIQNGRSANDMEHQISQINRENCQNELKIFTKQLFCVTDQIDQLKNEFENSLPHSQSSPQKIPSVKKLCRSVSQVKDKVSSSAFTYSFPDILDNHKTKFKTLKDKSKSEGKFLERYKQERKNTIMDMESTRYANSNVSLENYFEMDVLYPQKVTTDVDFETEETNLEEISALRKEIGKIENKLSDKHDKMFLLSQLFKSEKSSEASKLRSRCESDMVLNRDTMQTLRTELKQLKEEVANYVNMGLLITNRCGHLRQLHDFSKKLEDTEKEKQKLKCLMDRESQEKEVLATRLWNLEKELQFARRRKKKLITRCWRAITCSNRLPK